MVSLELRPGPVAATLPQGPPSHAAEGESEDPTGGTTYPCEEAPGLPGARFPAGCLSMSSCKTTH